MLDGIHYRSHHHHHVDYFHYLKTKPARVVRPEEVVDVLRHFEANQHNEIHADIRAFIQEMSILEAIQRKDIVFEKMVGLIDGC